MTKKRIRLHGRASKSVLEKVSLEYLEFDLKEDASYSVTKSNYICHRCVSKVESFDMKMKEIVKIREEILELVECNLRMNEEYADDQDTYEYEMRDPVEPRTTQTSSLTPSRKHTPSKINVSELNTSSIATDGLCCICQ